MNENSIFAKYYKMYHEQISAGGKYLPYCSSISWGSPVTVYEMMNRYLLNCHEMTNFLENLRIFVPFAR